MTIPCWQCNLMGEKSMDKVCGHPKKQDVIIENQFEVQDWCPLLKEGE